MEARRLQERQGSVLGATFRIHIRATMRYSPTSCYSPMRSPLPSYHSPTRSLVPTYTLVAGVRFPHTALLYNVRY